jgi:hypothetical protein
MCWGKTLARFAAIFQRLETGVLSEMDDVREIPPKP